MRLQTTAKTQATTPNIVGATVARVASSPGGDAICGMLVIALDLAPNGFSPGTPVLPLSLKFIQISVRSGNVDKEPFY